MKFQVFPTYHDPQTGFWNFILKDYLGRYVISTTDGPVRYHETHRRDVLIVNVNQAMTALNSSAREFQLQPTGRATKDYWWVALRDQCYWQQKARRSLRNKRE